jgi:phosphopantothenoylcysteine decarboxylase/phosphopantothenate--cysteine ligase
LLSAICLATQSPVAIAPAMNQQMWANAATQENLIELNKRGIFQFGPDEGNQACGEIGMGRMLEAVELAQNTAGLFETGSLAGLTVLVTAGPTQEAIDPVRYLSNRSSGKMGYAIAQAAAEAGARTLLISGPTALLTPPRVKRIDVKTGRQMQEMVMEHVGDCNIFISAAAIADYRVADPAMNKMKKQNKELTVQLVPNPDVLAEVAAIENGPYTVGFAAETENLEAHAREKLQHKKLDMIAANLVGEGKGFDADENALLVLFGAEQVELPQTNKEKLARQLIDLISKSTDF